MKVKIGDLVSGMRVRARAIVVQRKTRRPVQFELLDAEAVPLKTLIKPSRSEATLRRWNRQHRISRQSSPHALLEFSLPAVVMVEHGDYETLEKLRAGDRSDAMVRRYFDLLGLPS